MLNKLQKLTRLDQGEAFGRESATPYASKLLNHFRDNPDDLNVDGFVKAVDNLRLELGKEDFARVVIGMAITLETQRAIRELDE